MTTGSGAIAGATAASDAARDYHAVRGDGDIQFAPITPPKPAPPPEPPAWLKSFGEWLRDLFAPIGRLLRNIGEGIGISWPIFQWVLLGLAALLIAWLAWQTLAPLLERRRIAKLDEPEWVPDHAAAVALLDDADRLAAAGKYDEAAHLLLQRSVHHISEARPEWLHPASTAREISVLDPLPAKARTAFAAIASRVERSRYALRPLGAADWEAARAAYADFALERFTGLPA